MSESTTPRDLSREINVSPRRIRAYLRSRYGLLAEKQQTRWELTPEQAADVRRFFTAR